VELPADPEAVQDRLRPGSTPGAAGHAMRLAVAVAVTASCVLALSPGGGDRNAAVADAAAASGPNAVARDCHTIDNVAGPSRQHGSTLARLTAKIKAYKRPKTASPKVTLKPETAWSGQPTRLLVLEARCRGGTAWLRVLLPSRPNGHSRWIQRREAVLSRTNYWIDVSLNGRKVRVLRRGEIVREVKAVIGAPATPTPVGLAAVYENVRLPGRNDFLGSRALHLTSHSDQLFNYGGGKGRVALHGRGGASLKDPLGSARSHGCIRINNGPVEWISARVPTGTPVYVGRPDKVWPLVYRMVGTS